MGIIILIFLAALFTAWLHAVSSRQRAAYQREYDLAVQEYNSLCDDQAGLKAEIERLRSILERTIALYDVTKRICAYLDEEKVFGVFQEEIAKHLQVRSCQLVKGARALEPAAGECVVPVRIDVQHVGYLVAQGLRDEDRDTFSILSHQFVLGLRRSLLYQKIQEMAITDGLTNVLTRRFFLERCQEELTRSKKFRYQFSFLMVDLDHFKEYNDQYGHLVGDVLLGEAARVIKDTLRQIDLVGRYGGEEFAILLTETDVTGARYAAERIRQAICATSIAAYDEHLQITVSAGIAVYPKHGSSLTGLIEKADQALYQAKAGGRNRVCIFGQ